MTTDPSKQIKLGFISGLVPREKSMAFERILFRAIRGNVFLKQAVVEHPVLDPLSGEKVNTKIFNLKILISCRGSLYYIVDLSNYHASF